MRFRGVEELPPQEQRLWTWEIKTPCGNFKWVIVVQRSESQFVWSAACCDEPRGFVVFRLNEEAPSGSVEAALKQVEEKLEMYARFFRPFQPMPKPGVPRRSGDYIDEHRGGF